jgi:NADPH:quinone reductase-like Zn-dependent oxidoreductase
MSAADVIVRTGDTHAIIHPSSCRRHGLMRALTLVADHQLVIAEAPPPPGAGEVQIRVKMAGGMHPVIDTEVPIEDVAAALKRMESRQVFGKIVVGF